MRPRTLGLMIVLAAAPGWSGTQPPTGNASQAAHDLAAACRGKQGQEKNSCYERALLSVLANSGVKPAGRPSRASVL